MKNLLLGFFTLSLLLLIFSCNKSTNSDYRKAASDPALLHSCTEQLTDVVIFDIFKPPVATRIFTYSYLAAYEALKNDYPKYQTLSGKINGFPHSPQPGKNLEYCFPLASVKAFTVVGRALTFSADMWDNYEKDFFQKFKDMGISEEVYARSMEYGEAVAKHVLEYAGKDGYKTTRGYRHSLGEKLGCWAPTPPNYAEACEPKWNSIRCFTLDSCSQFAPPAPTAYDLTSNSPFYKLIKEVYEININLTEEQKNIAYFWDDNPMVTNIKGHASFAEKKMSPSVHWLAITKSISKKEKQDMMSALETYVLTSISLYDAFIACWDAKYKTDRIRPVSVINSTIDNKWLPFLETPSFPEYVSGHSSISASAGRVLSHIFGKNYAFIDSTEHIYGHGVRSFKSFEQAYWETSMSRVYGGIHFRDGVEQGTYQGEKVGEWVWAKLKNKDLKEEPIAENHVLPKTLKATTEGR